MGLPELPVSYLVLCFVRWMAYRILAVSISFCEVDGVPYSRRIYFVVGWMAYPILVMFCSLGWMACLILATSIIYSISYLFVGV
jgi:hypothetical protein